MNDFKYLEYLSSVCDEDIRFIKQRELLYKASWKKSHGRSAWFMVARKLNRLEEMMKFQVSESDQKSINVGGLIRTEVVKEALIADDIFKKIESDPSGRDATVLGEVRDLRRYLCMIEAEMISRGIVEESICLNMPIVENSYKVNKLGKLEDVVV